MSQRSLWQDRGSDIDDVNYTKASLCGYSVVVENTIPGKKVVVEVRHLAELSSLGLYIVGYKKTFQFYFFYYSFGKYAYRRILIGLILLLLYFLMNYGKGGIRPKYNTWPRMVVPHHVPCEIWLFNVHQTYAIQNCYKTVELQYVKSSIVCLCRLIYAVCLKCRESRACHRSATACQAFKRRDRRAVLK